MSMRKRRRNRGHQRKIAAQNLRMFRNYAAMSLFAAPRQDWLDRRLSHRHSDALRMYMLMCTRTYRLYRVMEEKLLYG